MNQNPAPVAKPPSRRSRKLQTRAALIQASVELIAELGYAETTLEAVAERANLHVQTLYRHFPSKELLAVAPEQDSLDLFKAAVRQKDPELPFTSFWREWAAMSADTTQTRYRELHLQRMRSLQTPAVMSQFHALANEYLDLLENGLADELPLDPKTSHYPRLFAAMLWEGNHHATHKWVLNQGRSDLVEVVTEVIDDVCKLMQCGNPPSCSRSERNRQ